MYNSVVSTKPQTLIFISSMYGKKEKSEVYWGTSPPSKRIKDMLLKPIVVKEERTIAQDKSGKLDSGDACFQEDDELDSLLLSSDGILSVTGSKKPDPYFSEDDELLESSIGPIIAYEELVDCEIRNWFSAHSHLSCVSFRISSAEVDPVAKILVDSADPDANSPCLGFSFAILPGLLFHQNVLAHFKGFQFFNFRFQLLHWGYCLAGSGIHLEESVQVVCVFQPARCMGILQHHLGRRRSESRRAQSIF